jgi:hypothetical protein
MTINGFSYNLQIPLKIMLKFGMLNFRSKFQRMPLVIICTTLLSIPFLVLFHFFRLDVSEKSIYNLFFFLFCISSAGLSIQLPSLLLPVKCFLCICRLYCTLLVLLFCFLTFIYISPVQGCIVLQLLPTLVIITLAFPVFLGVV